MDNSRYAEFWHGARDSLPMLFGAAPFGVIFGTLSGTSGLSPVGAIAMSLFVFAGSAQFIALSLLAAHASVLVILATTFIVNLRHALYSANLLPYLGKLPQRWRAALAFWLTDETFAVVQHRYGKHDASPFKHWYQLGSSVAMYVNWLCWTIVGLVLGQSVPGLAHMGLEFAMVATFTGIVVPMLISRPAWAAALTAAATALLARGLPYKLGLLCAALAGVFAGVVVERALKKGAVDELPA